MSHPTSPDMWRSCLSDWSRGRCCSADGRRFGQSPVADAQVPFSFWGESETLVLIKLRDFQLLQVQLAGLARLTLCVFAYERIKSHMRRPKSA